MELSRDRAASIRRLLTERHQIAASRIDIVGRGWEEPTSSTEPEQNRRVEVQWFTLE
jgi:NitT/TauT family transport system substrate-binding protein